MTAEPAMLFATCVLPGCDGAVEIVGEPCDTCVMDLGPFLARSSRPRPTVDQIAERDNTVLAIQRARREPERRANQLCWICDERHTCTRQRDGWECDECLEIR